MNPVDAFQVIKFKKSAGSDGRMLKNPFPNAMELDKELVVIPSAFSRLYQGLPSFTKAIWCVTIMSHLEDRYKYKTDAEKRAQIAHFEASDQYTMKTHQTIEEFLVEIRSIITATYSDDDLPPQSELHPIVVSKLICLDRFRPSAEKLHHKLTDKDSPFSDLHKLSLDALFKSSFGFIDKSYHEHRNLLKVHMAKGGTPSSEYCPEIIPAPIHNSKYEDSRPKVHLKRSEATVHDVSKEKCFKFIKTGECTTENCMRIHDPRVREMCVKANKSQPAPDVKEPKSEKSNFIQKNQIHLQGKQTWNKDTPEKPQPLVIGSGEKRPHSPSRPKGTNEEDTAVRTKYGNGGRLSPEPREENPNHGRQRGRGGGGRGSKRNGGRSGSPNVTFQLHSLGWKYPGGSKGSEPAKPIRVNNSSVITPAVTISRDDESLHPQVRFLNKNLKASGSEDWVKAANGKDGEYIKRSRNSQGQLVLRADYCVHNGFRYYDSGRAEQPPYLFYSRKEEDYPIEEDLSPFVRFDRGNILYPPGSDRESFGIFDEFGHRFNPATKKRMSRTSSTGLNTAPNTDQSEGSGKSRRVQEREQILIPLTHHEREYSHPGPSDTAHIHKQHYAHALTRSSKGATSTLSTYVPSRQPSTSSSSRYFNVERTSVPNSEDDSETDNGTEQDDQEVPYFPEDVRYQDAEVADIQHLTYTSHGKTSVKDSFHLKYGSKVPTKDTALMDTGAVCHIFKSQMDGDLPFATSQKLILTNNQEMKIAGIVESQQVGTYAVVPSSIENIISVQQLADKGMMCVIAGDYLTILRKGMELTIEPDWIQSIACRHTDGLFRVPLEEFCEDFQINKPVNLSKSAKSSLN